MIEYIFGFAFVELILDIINFVEIDFEVKWFMFGNSSKSDYNKK